MNKSIVPALIALGLLTACSGGAETLKEGSAVGSNAPAMTAAAADDDNDAAAPSPATAEDDHPHAEGEAAHDH